MSTLCGHLLKEYVWEKDNAVNWFKFTFTMSSRTGTTEPSTLWLHLSMWHIQPLPPQTTSGPSTFMMDTPYLCSDMRIVHSTLYSCPLPPTKESTHDPPSLAKPKGSWQVLSVGPVLYGWMNLHLQGSIKSIQQPRTFFQLFSDRVPVIV